ncbi:hypothetical protein MHYP_G00089000 [Metynnis hypsauchen]
MFAADVDTAGVVLRIEQGLLSPRERERPLAERTGEQRFPQLRGPEYANITDYISFYEEIIKLCDYTN